MDIDSIKDKAKAQKIIYLPEKDQWLWDGVKAAPKHVASILEITETELTQIKGKLSKGGAFMVNYVSNKIEIPAIKGTNKADEEFLDAFQLAHKVSDFSTILIVRNKNKNNITLVKAKEISPEFTGAVSTALLYSGMNNYITEHLEKYNTVLNDILRGKDSLNKEEIELIMEQIPSIILENSEITYEFDKKEGTMSDFYFSSGDKKLSFSSLSKQIPTQLKRMGKPMVKISDIKLFTNDMNELSVNKIDLKGILSTARGKDTPAWDEWMSKFHENEKDAVMFFIYSIFDVSNQGRQILWVRDNGKTGKSTFTKVITRVLGEELVGAIQKDSLSNQFSMAKYWDKRLVIMPDSKNRMLIRSEKVHMLSGGDLVEVEGKGQNSFSSLINCKLIVFSNEPPIIDVNVKHENSRLLYICPEMDPEIEKKTELGDNTFADRLYNEFNEFLWKCKDVYKRLCPGGCDIKVDGKVEENMSEILTVEEEATQLFMEEMNIKDDPDGVVLISKMRLLFKQFKEKTRGAYEVDFDDIQDFWRRNYGVKINGKTHEFKGLSWEETK